MSMIKEEIKKLWYEYRKPPYHIDVSNDDIYKNINIYHEDDDEALATMITCKEDNEEDYNVLHSNSRIKRLGKLLYYVAMNSIYPKWLRPDSGGYSKEAKRVWDKLDEVDYVESVNDPIYEFVNKKEEDYYSNRKYRFSFKNKHVEKRD